MFSGLDENNPVSLLSRVPEASQSNLNSRGSLEGKEPLYLLTSEKLFANNVTCRLVKLIIDTVQSTHNIFLNLSCFT